jgi:hypothetical protein
MKVNVALVSAWSPRPRTNHRDGARTHPRPGKGGWEVVALSVERAEGIAGKNDLLSSRIEQPVRVRVRRELLGAAGAGWRLDLRARLTQSGAIAENCPKTGDFTASPP